MKTYSIKPADITREWHIIDASTTTLGRLSTVAATLLTGKSKPQYSHHIDCGDYVIVINADKLNVTGKKLIQKEYATHSGYPGGITIERLSDKVANKSAEVITHAVRGMLPVNKLRDGRMARLKVYPGNEHNHEAQKPKSFVIRGTK